MGFWDVLVVDCEGVRDALLKRASEGAAGLDMRGVKLVVT